MRSLQMFVVGCIIGLITGAVLGAVVGYYSGVYMTWIILDAIIGFVVGGAIGTATSAALKNGSDEDNKFGYARLGAVMGAISGWLTGYIGLTCAALTTLGMAKVYFNDAYFLGWLFLALVPAAGGAVIGAFIDGVIGHVNEAMEEAAKRKRTSDDLPS